MRLGDVANVIDDVENNRVAGWVDGERAVLLIIRRQPGANIIEVIERVKALLPALARLDLAGHRRRRSRSTAAQTIRASVARRRVHAGPQRGAGGAGGLRVPAQRARHA